MSLPPAATHPIPTRLRVRVIPAAERAIRSGHPWVFDASIKEQNRPGAAGELAVVYDRQDRFLAIGWFDPESPLRLRILHHGPPATLDDAWWENRLTAAIGRRTGLFDDTTNGYRILYGESDGFPALVADRYADTLVVKVYSRIWRPHLAAFLPRLVKVIHAADIPIRRIVYRTSRNAADALEGWQDGLGWNIAKAGIQPWELPQPLLESEESIVFLEHSLRFFADVARGQKTGFFLDQRENRKAIGDLAMGRDVLNAFSFSGGFSVHAAAGGARSVTDVDISAHALESARKNFSLNAALPAVAACRYEGIQADAFRWLADSPGGRYDIVIADPPALAKRESERAGAIDAYRALVASAIRMVRPGGHLLAASCSGHVSAGEFHGAVASAIRSSGGRWTSIWTRGHPADHAATFPEGEYLKAALWKSDPRSNR